ncbi:MAG: TrkA family potassium uptake protein [Actinomycetes bacterium]
MHVVIMGCGRVGSSLATELEAAGHSVAIIDQAREAFRRLGPDFKGTTVTGVGFDRDILREAGIERADAFAAVSNGDNSNILAARVAGETFGVKNVVARIYDPGRAEIYQRLGIPTVATVLWAMDQILRRLLPEGSRSEWRDANTTVSLCEMHMHNDWYGRQILLIDELTSARVAFITRLGVGMIPNEHTVLQQGDLVHVMVADDQTAIVESILANSPEGGR